MKVNLHQPLQPQTPPPEHHTDVHTSHQRLTTVRIQLEILKVLCSFSHVVATKISPTEARFIMSFSAAPPCNYNFSGFRLPYLSSSPQLITSVSFKSPPSIFNRRTILTVRSASVQAPPTSGGVAPAISLTDTAMKHLNKMKSDRNEDLCLRIGVKQGGCSGMSYTMEFENRENARPDDSLIEYNGFTIVCDPKSLLFVFGMQLDYSDALIGGGFSFKNPNATQTCGCGKSFAAEM